MDLQPQLNRQSPLALYYQLKRIILAQIEDGTYKDGDRLPSEAELTNRFHVSRHVVRQALNYLIAEGKITSIQGMGYFVNKRRYRKALLTLGSHTKSIAKLGRPARTLVISQKVINCPENIRIKLLPPGEHKVIFLERVSFVDEEPVALLSAFYPTRFITTLLERDLNNRSVYDTLFEQNNILPKHANTVISLEFSDERLSRLLDIREGTPLFHLDSSTWSDQEELFEISSNFYRVDRFELEYQQS